MPTARRTVRGVFVPKKYGAWQEERLREREAERALPPNERLGNWRSVSNGDFSEEEIKVLEAQYRATIRRPARQK